MSALFSDSTLRKKTQLKILPPTPETGWRPPREFPNLAAAKIIGVDTENKEMDFARGPGWSRNKVKTVGLSMCAYDGRRFDSWYFPTAHEVEPEYNLDPSRVWAWAKDTLQLPMPKVGANLTYDTGNLTDLGIFPEGKLYDVQSAEALLEEDSEVNLDYLGAKYLGRGKETNQLYAWSREAYGNPKYDQRENIFRCSPRLVGPYAEQDASDPIKILMKQWPLLEQQGLLDVFHMETDLIPLIVAMRREGVRVDIPAAEALYAELSPLIDTERLKLKEATGIWANVNSSDDLAKVFDAVKLTYPRTALGAPSFVKAWLQSHEHPIAKMVLQIRAMEKIQSTFIRAYLLEANVNGRVHGQFHLLRGDEDGTRSGRFSSSDPNLQNIPARSALGKRIRKLFIPDEGHAGWTKGDFSQIEYRYLMHYAVGPGAEEGRARYRSDPHTDYHKMTQKTVQDVSGELIPRNAEEAAAGDGKFGNLTIKEINFGLLYGMGESKLGRMAQLNDKMRRTVFNAYHQGNPYVKETMKATVAEVNQFGCITTIMMRRSRFNEWEPEGFRKGGQRAMPLPFNSAVESYGHNIKRAGTHKAINRRLQGSAADQIKKGMLDCWRKGLFRVTGVPRLTVHDELDFSRIDNSPAQREAFAEVKNTMEGAFKLRVPVLFDMSEGPNWGSCE